MPDGIIHGIIHPGVIGIPGTDQDGGDRHMPGTGDGVHHGTGDGDQPGDRHGAGEEHGYLHTDAHTACRQEQ